MNPNGRKFVALAGLLLASGMFLGALGAHALRGHLEPQQLASYDVAVRYQLVNALGLLVIGVSMGRLSSRALTLSAWLILVGVLLFSGSIYALSFGAPRAFGPVTPMGGLLLIAGWLLFAGAYLKATR